MDVMGQETPDGLFGVLFKDVQESRVFADSKTFVDCIPKRQPDSILKDYLAIKNNPAIRFSLKQFVEANFILPHYAGSNYHTVEKDVVKHIENLWKLLQRHSDSIATGGSLLPLPFEYIEPGGRFREIYYWDSYFTMLGLRESTEYDLIESMINNFGYLATKYGHIPNGNRSYYLSRSQPPFFSLMIELLAAIKGDTVYTHYLPSLLKEYGYWMDKNGGTEHVVKMPDGSVLNRYWDQLYIPRQESYYEDIHTANFYPEKQVLFYKDIRSAAESGWDFSSRWFKDGKTLSTIQTTSLIPVDLNCLLYHLEETIAKAYKLNGDENNSNSFTEAAAKRKKAILHYCWSPKQNWFVDYNIVTKQQSPELTLAGMTPFFCSFATKAQMLQAKEVLEKKFLKPGGVVTTLKATGQQWDAPNGWAPLQWITITGLENYGQKGLAKIIARRWITLNKRVFSQTGKLVEKYDVVHGNRPGGGGEYPSQDGFGWTNGVLLALMKKYLPLPQASPK